MGFFVGATETFTRPLLEEAARRRRIADLLQRQALEGYLSPDTPPELREQYRQFLRGTPYEAFAGLTIPESPEAALRRELGPLLSGAQALGALGQTGLLTPELAQQIEGIIGRGEILPRREVTVPGEVLVPERELTPFERFRAGERGERLLPGGRRPAIHGEPTTQRVVDISRFQPQAGITVKLYTGEQVPLDVLKGLSSDLQMYLIQGPRGQGARTYGELFGEALKPDWRSVPVQVRDGVIVFPPQHAFVEPPSPLQRITQQKFEVQRRAAAEYARVLKATGDVNRAWKAASAIDPVTFKPELTSPAQAADQSKRAQRLRALEAFNDAIRAGRSQQDAYNAAFAIDPSFPAPATMPRAQDVTVNQLERAVNDLQAEIAGLQQLQASGGDPDEYVLVGNQYVFRSDLPALIAQRQAQLRSYQQQLRQLQGQQPTGGPMRLPPAPEWASAQIAEMRTRGITTRQQAMALFRKARARDAGNKAFPLDYWRALYDAIQREFQ